jgi:hypothetical protein
MKLLASPLPAKPKGTIVLGSVRRSVRHIKILSCPDFFFYVLWYIDLICGMWLYLDDLQFKFEFRSGRMIFGWVMALEFVFFVQILSCPDFFLTSFDILTWYLVCGYI